ncbi:MAG: deoxyhypusine synthase family protein, partial [SAR324 cluster bacterium]|nr:deoxyhypusine synthase family protein [SAR324 cluster bacterium]
MSKFSEIDLSGVRRIPFAERKTKVDVEMFGKTALDDDSFHKFFQGLPDILVAKDLKILARRTAGIISEGKKVVVMMGAHLIKTGLSPLFVELLRRKAISCLVLNGAGIIHDFEVAMFG